MESTQAAPWLLEIFEKAALGIALVDMQGRPVQVNPALERLSGYSAAELRTVTLDQVTHPADLPRDRELLRQLLRGQRTEYQVENRYLRKDGCQVWGHLTVSLVRNADGQATHALALIEDITARKEAEAALEQREAKFRALIENASDLVTVLAADGTVLYDSPSVERILGYRPEERVGSRIFELVHPDDLERITNTFAELAGAPGASLSYLLRYRHQDGSYRWLDGLGTNLLADPAVEGIVANSRDITERRAAEEALEREHALFERLFESSPEGVALVDREDRVLRINREFTRIFGYAEGEAAGRTIRELLLPPDSEQDPLSITRRIARGERVQLETVRRRKDGSPVDVSVQGVPIDLGGERVAVYGIYQDITDRKEMEYALRRMSTTDVLTGLLNRRGFMELAEREWALASRRHQDLLILFADLDGFKQINDVHGHAEGDRLLQEVGGILRRAFRCTDVIGRMGGDEFVVLAVDAADETECTLAERLRVAVKRFNQRSTRPYQLSLSIGTHRAPPGSAMHVEALLAEADRQMYEQKRERKAGMR